MGINWTAGPSVYIYNYLPPCVKQAFHRSSQCAIKVGFIARELSNRTLKLLLKINKSSGHLSNPKQPGIPQKTTKMEEFLKKKPFHNF